MPGPFGILLIIVGVVIIGLGLVGRSRLKKDSAAWTKQSFPYNMGSVPHWYWWALLIGFCILLFGFGPW